MPVVQGVRSTTCAGRRPLPESQCPGEIGNFAVAGHRATNGEPLATSRCVRWATRSASRRQDTWYTYTVVDSTEIVAPTDVG